MSTKTTFALALAAGLLGGISSQLITPALAYAQSQISIPKEIRAESFVIVDANGKPRGAFAIDPKDGLSTIEFTDPKGNAYRGRWYPMGFFHASKPTVVPPQ